MTNSAAVSRSTAKTRLVASLAMLCAISYVVTYLSKLIPFSVVGFLQFDFKDVIIAIGGFIYGPLPAVAVSLIVSFFEMITFSSTGPIGLLMNVLSTCAFVCPAAYLYKKHRTMSSAVIGLVLGALCMTGAMVLWNYLITPLYMGVERSVVVTMLIPTFLPFNLVKAGMNAAVTLLLYKPIVTALRKAGLAPEHVGSKSSVHTGVVILSAVVLVTCALLGLALAGVI